MYTKFEVGDDFKNIYIGDDFSRNPGDELGRNQANNRVPRKTKNHLMTGKCRNIEKRRKTPKKCRKTPIYLPLRNREYCLGSTLELPTFTIFVIYIKTFLALI